MAAGRSSLARGRMVVNEEMCKGCELCTTVCPYGLIRMDTHYNAKGYRPAKLVDPDSRCTGCTLCALICPDAVITIFRHVRVHSQTKPKPRIVTA